MKLHNSLFSHFFLVITLALAACSQQPTGPQATTQIPHGQAPKTTAVAWQPAHIVANQQTAILAYHALASNGENRFKLVSHSQNGMQVLTHKNQVVATLAGTFDSLDQRLLPNSTEQWLVSGVDTTTQKVVLSVFTNSDTNFSQPISLPKRDFALAGACLYQNEGNSFVFVVGEDGYGEQWLVATGGTLLNKAQRIRAIPMPPEAEYCQADDASSTLFVNEETVGLWAYPAKAEAQTRRQPVALVAPFGALAQSAGNMAVIAGGVAILDPDAAALQIYQPVNEGWALSHKFSLGNISDPKQLNLQLADNHITALVRDDDAGVWLQSSLPFTTPYSNQSKATSLNPTALPIVYPHAETAPVAHHGDAADDPAIWIHPSKPSQSLILGTNKKAGLQVYTLAGEQVQSLPIGRLNNVDLRSHVTVGNSGKKISIAAASHRDHNSISLFTINNNGQVAFHSDVATPIAEIYGLCLYQPTTHELYAFANGKDGLVIQYHIAVSEKAGNIQLTGKEVRRFELATQPEGCVADDANQQLFIGEEDVGVWRLSANPEGSVKREMILPVGDTLKDDVEGLALYNDKTRNRPLLVISSQGNDSYIVMDSQAPYTIRTVLRVGINAALGIDGASETDGLDVTSANLGGPWSEGFLVVQDGHNRMPEEPQNFKVIPWSEIAPLLK